MKTFKSKQGGRSLKRLRMTSRKVPLATKIRRVVENSEEKKYFETAGSQADTTATGVIVPLNNIAEGNDFNQRDGRKVRNKYVEADVVMAISTAQAVAGTTRIGTWHLVLDRQPNGTAPTFGQIFDTTICEPWQAYKNVQQFAQRFKILKTERFVIGTAEAGQTYRLNAFINMMNLSDVDQITHWPGSTGVVPNTNALYLVYVSDETAGSQCVISWATRVVYVDM